MLILKQSLFSRFRRDRRGNISVMFSLALLPMIGFIGAAVDYSRAAMVRSRLQGAIDATALKLTRDGSTLSNADITTMANRFFLAVLDTTDLVSAPTLTVSRSSTGVQLSAAASINTSFMKAVGFDTLDVGIGATSVFDNSKIELALVLDNTGSMAQSGKMTALKDALTNSKTGVLTQIKAMDPTGTRVKVAIVPFDTQVNVGSGYQTKVNGKYTYPNWLGFSDLPGFAPKTDPKGMAVADVNSSWAGCISDRAEPYNTDLYPPAISIQNTRYPAWQCDTIDSYTKKPVLGKIQPLTNDQTALTNAVNAMTPSGNTNVAIGFHWGLRMLENGTTPLGLGVTFGTPDVKKYIVLLTDGDNTQDRYTTSQNQIDSRTQSVCNTIKATGNVTVFTVRVIEGNAALLQACASTPTASIPQTYFEVKSSSGISDALNTILKQITGIRLTS